MAAKQMAAQIGRTTARPTMIACRRTSTRSSSPAVHIARRRWRGGHRSLHPHQRALRSQRQLPSFGPRRRRRWRCCQRRRHWRLAGSHAGGRCGGWLIRLHVRLWLSRACCSSQVPESAGGRLHRIEWHRHSPACPPAAAFHLFRTCSLTWSSCWARSSGVSAPADPPVYALPAFCQRAL